MVNDSARPVVLPDVLDDGIGGVFETAVDNMVEKATYWIAVAKTDRVTVAVTDRKEIDLEHNPGLLIFADESVLPRGPLRRPEVDRSCTVRSRLERRTSVRRNARQGGVEGSGAAIGVLFFGSDLLLSTPGYRVRN
jgi:hypothetical protein